LYFDRDWDRGFLTSFPEHSSVRSALNLLVSSAKVNQLKGSSQAAVSDLEAALRLASLYTQETSDASNFTSSQFQKIALEGYSNVATTRRAQNRSVKDLIASLEKSKFKLDFDESLRFESYVSLATLRNADKYGGISQVAQIRLTGLNENQQLAEIPADTL